MADDDKPLWNSLEIVKILVSTATPLAVVLVGASLSAQSQRQAIERSSEEKAYSETSAKYAKLVEKRVLLWDRLGPDLNSIYEFADYVGSWKSYKASDMVRIKRECDKIFYSYRPYFSDEFSRSYGNFMSAAFRTGNGMGVDAMVRSSTEFRHDPEPRRFTGEDNGQEVFKAYFALLAVVAKELDLTITPPEYRPRSRREPEPELSRNW